MKLRPEPILIGLVCLGPFALALLLYFGPVDEAGLPVVDNPERELLAPVRSLPALALHTAQGEPVAEPWASYRWALIYVASLPCAETCRAELARLAQIHAALGHDRVRLRRVFLYAGDGPPSVEDPVLISGRLDPSRKSLWNELFALGPAYDGRYFVADPLGNLVVAYPGDANREAMLEDLERLLDVSRIG